MARAIHQSALQPYVLMWCIAEPPLNWLVLYRSIDPLLDRFADWDIVNIAGASRTFDFPHAVLAINRFRRS
jgi:hypothetical protein